MLRRTEIVFLFGCLLLLITSNSLSARVYRFESSHEYDVQPDFKLHVDNISGDIKVSYQPGEKLVVDVVKEVHARSRDDAEDIETQIDVEIDAGKKSIDIRTVIPDRLSRSGFLGALFNLGGSADAHVNYYIRIPVSVELSITTASSDIKIAGIGGRVDIESTSGDIEIDEVTANCSIHNTSGDFQLRDVKGDVSIGSTSSDAVIHNLKGDLDLRCSSGDTEIYWVVGNVYITKTSGDVRIEDCSGDVDVSTTSGDISVQQREGGVFISSTSGDVTVRSELSEGSKFDVETVSGDIYFQLPTEASGRVRIETMSGNIDSNLALKVRNLGEKKVEANLGEGGPLIKLSSTSGDIALEGY
jgi:DUF4097 and DUF4098 domain-containing protein YvlB